MLKPSRTLLWFLGHCSAEDRQGLGFKNERSTLSVSRLEGDGSPDLVAPDRYIINVATLIFKVTYKPAGTAKIRESRARQPTL